MNLVKEIITSRLFIEIYSINSNLVVSEDVTVFEDKDDYQIKDIVLNQIGAEQVNIYDFTTEGEKENLRSYSIV